MHVTVDKVRALLSATERDLHLARQARSEAQQELAAFRATERAGQVRASEEEVVRAYAGRLIQAQRLETYVTALYQLNNALQTMEERLGELVEPPYSDSEHMRVLRAFVESAIH